jgi:glycosyltransferase involved in cell wall biosynthesis
MRRPALSTSKADLRTAPVVVNGSPLWPPVTGVQRVARGLTRQLLAEAQPGEVVVLGGPEEFAGDRRPYPGRARRVLWEQLRLPLAGIRAEVVLNLGNLAPLSSRKNLVLTYDLHALHLPQHYRAGWAPLYWKMSAHAYRRARHRVTLSRTIADELEATLGGRVDAVIPPGVDPPFRPVSAERRERLRRELRLDGPFLVVVGWAQPAKRARLALQAHHALVGDIGHQLVIVGAQRSDFAPVDLGRVPASVVMAGSLGDEELAALYSASSGLLFPTEYEGFGLPPVEALACGAPVAASDIPVLRETLAGLPGVGFVEGATAEDWAEAAAELLAGDSDEEVRRTRSEGALERYPWEGKGRALLDVVGR